MIVKPILTDEETEQLRGTYITEDHITHLITEDENVYTEDGKLLLKFRKKRFNETLTELGFSGFKYLAKASRGRGASAGPIDPESIYWKKRKITKYKKWSANYEIKGKESKMRVNNEVASNPIGFYGATKSLGVDLPCRLSHYTRVQFYKYKEGLPFIEEISKSYQELAPEEFNKQLERAELKPDFRIEGTPFSTITVNRNFRTAVHTDKGDWGFGNLAVIERGKYHGGYFVFPQYGIGVDMRTGDHLCCDVHQYHGNTELWETEQDREFNNQMEDIFKDNLEVGVLGLNNRFCRLSFVCYLRENIINCPEDNSDNLFLQPELSETSMKIFYINLRNASERRKKFKNTNYNRWEATNREEVAPDFSKNMVSYWNVPAEQHLGKCACYVSHIRLLKEIVKQKLNYVLILEDDAVKVTKIPNVKIFPPDSITYLGGFIGNKKITSKEKIEIDHKKGINELDLSKYRMLMTMSYFIPRWEVAEGLLTQLENKTTRPRAIDIDICNVLDSVYYYYPACFEEENVASDIRKGSKKHSDKFYNWIGKNKKSLT
jgi:hypothetical protein